MWMARERIGLQVDAKRLGRKWRKVEKSGLMLEVTIPICVMDVFINFHISG